MASDNQLIPPPAPDRDVAPVFSAEELVFTPDEQARIAAFRKEYPTPEGAVMKTLWLAQEKFSYLPPEVMQLVADELGIPFAHVYGVTSFYTQYYRKAMGKYVLDVCTCFSCQMCGGYDILHYLEDTLGIKKGETTADGLFTVQEVECLGACGSAPLMQVTNGPYVHHLTPEKVDALLEDLKAGRVPGMTAVTLPQDEAELGANRRTDAEHVAPYQAGPVSESFR